MAMMISWRLWQALKHPPEEHPLYRHTLASAKRKVSVPARGVSGSQQPSDVFPFGEQSFGQPGRVVVVQPSNSSRNTVYKVLAVLGLGWFCCCSGGVFVSLPALMLLLAVGTLYGAYTAVRISGNIAQEHEQGRDELLSLTPSGALGLSWAAVTGHLYRNNTFTRLRKWMPIACVVLTLLSSGFLAFVQINLLISTPASRSVNSSAYQYDGGAQQVVFLLYVAAAAAAFLIDFYQSVIAGVLIAVITPTYGRNRFETQALTLAGFLSVQIVTYLSALLIGLVVLPGIYQALSINDWIGEAILIVLRIGVFVLIREAFIVWLWQFAQQRLNIGIGEFETLVAKLKRDVPLA
jgi:hypothetical protein